MSLARLQKIIAESGVLSRRKAEDAITQGRVTVNGMVITELGTKVDGDSDQIVVDGRELRRAAVKTVIALHKPRRVVTTKSDPEGRPTVMDYLPSELQHLKPVGRLDFDSEGLLLLTDDGELANRIMHPRYGIHKSYLAWVQGSPSAESLRILLKNVALADGPGRFEAVTRREGLGASTILEIVVSEGRNRFVRRMLEAIGHPVVRLRRTRVGQLELGELPAGRWRKLQAAEMDRLFASSGRPLTARRGLLP